MIRENVGVFFQSLVGSSLFLGGLFLSCWARLELGPAWSVTPIDPGYLVDWGPYSKLRNPMYLGGALWVTGLFIFLGWWQALAAFLPTYTIIQSYRASLEEQHLAMHFGERYRVYHERTWF